MRRFTVLAAAAAAVLAFSAPAEARRHHHHQAQHHHRQAAPVWAATMDNNGHYVGQEAPVRAERPSRVRHGYHHRAKQPATDANGNDVAAAPAVSPTIEGYRDRPEPRPVGRGLVTVNSAAGPITVAPSFVAKIVPFIGDVVARGFRGRVKCYSLSSSHVPGSLHFSGRACDFAQRGWGKTVAPMYHVGDLTAKYGLRNGCSFADCGHIDSGGALSRRHAKHPTRYKVARHVQ